MYVGVLDNNETARTNEITNTIVSHSAIELGNKVEFVSDGVLACDIFRFDRNGSPTIMAIANENANTQMATTINQIDSDWVVPATISEYRTADIIAERMHPLQYEHDPK